MTQPQPIHKGWAWYYSRSTDPRLQTQSTSYLKARRQTPVLVYGSIQSIRKIKTRRRGGGTLQALNGTDESLALPHFHPSRALDSLCEVRSRLEGRKSEGKRRAGQRWLFLFRQVQGSHLGFHLEVLVEAQDSVSVKNRQKKSCNTLRYH